MKRMSSGTRSTMTKNERYSIAVQAMNELNSILDKAVKGEASQEEIKKAQQLAFTADRHFVSLV